MPFLDLTDERFGRLVAKELLGREKGHTIWNCLCDCGNWKKVSVNALRRGMVKSCGCLRRDLGHERTGLGGVMDQRKHGMWRSPEYAAWRRMLNDCLNENSKSYGRYGGRGITICAAWRASFDAFLFDVGFRPLDGHSLGRIKNDLGYWCGHCDECSSLKHPANCRWETDTQQQRNTSYNRLLTLQGRTQCVAAWAEEFGVPWTRVYDWTRRGWSEEKILAHVWAPRRG